MGEGLHSCWVAESSFGGVGLLNMAYYTVDQKTLGLEDVLSGVMKRR